MKPLFTPSGRKLLAKHVSQDCLFIFDFDGVLAPLIAQRHKVRPKQSTLRLIRELQKRATVAVVTGRGISDIRPKLHFQPTYLVGNHGAEGLKGLWKDAKRVKTVVAGWKREMSQVLVNEPGLDLEDKRLSISIHYRHCADPQAGKRLLVRTANTLRPKPRLVHGQMVVNLVWPKAPTKGTAVAALMKRTGFKHYFFMGDDYTDEDAFRLNKSRLLTVKVGYRRGSRAKYYIENQLAVDKLLREILAAL